MSDASCGRQASTTSHSAIDHATHRTRDPGCLLDADETGTGAQTRRREQPSDRTADAVRGHAAGDRLHVGPRPGGVVDLLAGREGAHGPQSGCDGGDDEGQDETGVERDAHRKSERKREDGAVVQSGEEVGVQLPETCRDEVARDDPDERAEDAKRPAPPNAERDHRHERDAEGDFHAAELGAEGEVRTPGDTHADARKIEPDRHENDAGNDRRENLAKLSHDFGEAAFRQAGNEDHARHQGHSALRRGDQAYRQVNRRDDRRAQIARADGPAAHRLQQRVDRNPQHRHRHEGDRAVCWKSRCLDDKRHENEIGAHDRDVLKAETDPAREGRPFIETENQIRGFFHRSREYRERGRGDNSAALHNRDPDKMMNQRYLAGIIRRRWRRAVSRSCWQLKGQTG